MCRVCAPSTLTISFSWTATAGRPRHGDGGRASGLARCRLRFRIAAHLTHCETTRYTQPRSTATLYRGTHPHDLDISAHRGRQSEDSKRTRESHLQRFGGVAEPPRGTHILPRVILFAHARGSHAHMQRDHSRAARCQWGALVYDTLCASLRSRHNLIIAGALC